MCVCVRVCVCASVRCDSDGASAANSTPAGFETRRASGEARIPGRHPWRAAPALSGAPAAASGWSMLLLLSREGWKRTNRVVLILNNGNRRSILQPLNSPLRTAVQDGGLWAVPLAAVACDEGPTGAGAGP